MKALEIIDFQCPDDELELFIDYVKIHYGMNPSLPLETKFPKYFKFLLKEILQKGNIK